MAGFTSKTTLETLRSRKREGRKTPVLTCYDFSTARLMAEAGIDVILVGDTYAEVCLGHPSTLPVTLEEMLSVTAAVRRGSPEAYLIGDMPYMSYQASLTEAVRNAGRFMAEAGCDCVKVEVDAALADVVASLSRAGIPTMAHLGLRPQSVHRHSGYRGQGRDARGALAIVEDARRMEEAGASALLLEAVPDELAGLITERATVPVIGCVAGPHCDGTVVVLHDMLGYSSGHPPRSVKRYADVHAVLTQAFSAYADEVRASRYPEPCAGVRMAPEEWSSLQRILPAMTPLDDESGGRRNG